MSYHGSALDIPHAGLLTLIVLAWMLWAAVGWWARGFYDRHFR